MWSPPALLDDVDAVQSNIARTMLESGDWITPKLNGVRYLEKPPMKYWLMASSMAIFGPHDWAGRLPIALGIVGLCVLVTAFGRWAFGAMTGMWAGLILATSIGLWLFTRMQIADPLLTLTIALAMWSLLRTLDSEEKKPLIWSRLLAISLGFGALLKGLIAAVFPLGAAFLFLAITGLWRSRETWNRLKPFSNAALAVLVAGPWHVAAALANPPVLDLTLQAGSTYRGFTWFYFLNEHVFRFLNMRYPRDYNTVPRHLFLLYHLLWFFPWSMWLPAIFRGPVRQANREARTRLLAFCWIGFLLLFFSFSTTQEYYSMPAYPAFALLLADAMRRSTTARTWSPRVAGAIALAAFVAICLILAQVWNLPAPGDISNSLVQQSTETYTLALGHMGDLTIKSFAYLRTPLIIAGMAFLIGAVGALLQRYPRVALAAMMVLLLHAARIALATFEPYLSSKPLADALNAAPPGRLIVDDQYYTFSSVIFYSRRDVLLLNGKVNNLEYGLNAPDAPNVILTDAQFPSLWQRSERWYIVASTEQKQRLQTLAGPAPFRILRESGGKMLATNQ